MQPGRTVLHVNAEAVTQLLMHLQGLQSALGCFTRPNTTLVDVIDQIGIRNNRSYPFRIQSKERLFKPVYSISPFTAPFWPMAPDSAAH